MNKLFVITSFSELMLERLTMEYLKTPSNVYVLTTSGGFYDMYRGIFKNMLLINSAVRTPNKDAEFAKLAMPGKLDGEVFGDTGLEIWKVLSLDRLKFWYEPEFKFAIEFVGKGDWDVVYVSSDLGSTLPLMAGYMAECPGVWVKTESIKTREFVDLMQSGVFPFNNFVVGTAEDSKFISSLRPDVKIMMGVAEEQLVIQQSSRDALRQSLGISGRVLCVLFDKRDEFQCREFMLDGSYKDFYNHVYLAPVDNRSAELMYTSIPFAHRYYMHTKTLMKIADAFISFRWDDAYTSGLPFPVHIIDYNGMNKAKMLAPEGIKVQ